MTEDMKKDDAEIEALWGESWDDGAKRSLQRLGSVDAPVALKHRILNREFGESRKRVGARFGKIGGALVAAALCAILVLKTHQAAPPRDELSDNDVMTLAEVLDSDEAVSDISFQLLDGDDDIDLVQEDV